MLRHIAERDAKQPQKQKKKKKKQTKKPVKKARKKTTSPTPKNVIKGEEEGEKEEQEEVRTKCMKYRIFPNTKQKELLKLWVDATRWVYNRAVEKLNSKQKGTKESLTLLRQWAGTADEEWKKKEGGETPERFADVPYEIRDSPLRDVAAACASLRSKEKTLHRRLKFRKRKDDTSSITLRARQLNCKTGQGSVWPPLFGTALNRATMKTERGKTLPLIFDHDCRLLYERRTRFFYLCVPVPLAIVAKSVDGVPETQGEATITTTTSASTTQTTGEEAREKKLVSIDPGMRTFGTCYDPDGLVTEWAEGSGHVVLLFRLNRKAGRVEAKSTKASGRRKRRLVAVASRIRKRSIDLVNELHRKFARWLCSNHDVVLLPKFDTRSIVRKRSDTTGTWTRKIGKKTAGAAMRLAHFRFRNFLLHKADEFGTKIEICDEQYTSKTCGACGKLNDTLGSAKVFSCKTCGYVADRDHNAARNILLRYLTINDIKLEGVSCADST